MIPGTFPSGGRGLAPSSCSRRGTLRPGVLQVAVCRGPAAAPLCFLKLTLTLEETRGWGGVLTPWMRAVSGAQQGQQLPSWRQLPAQEATWQSRPPALGRAVGSSRPAALWVPPTPVRMGSAGPLPPSLGGQGSPGPSAGACDGGLGAHLFSPRPARARCLPSRVTPPGWDCGGLSPRTRYGVSQAQGSAAHPCHSVKAARTGRAWPCLGDRRPCWGRRDCGEERAGWGPKGHALGSSAPLDGLRLKVAWPDLHSGRLPWGRVCSRAGWGRSWWDADGILGALRTRGLPVLARGAMRSGLLE